MDKLYEVITAQESENDYQERVRSWNVRAGSVTEAIERVKSEIDETNLELAKDGEGETYIEYVDEVRLIATIDRA